MDINDIPHISLSLNESNINENIPEILKKVRPGWKSKQIKTKILTDGITNKLILCTLGNDIEENVLIRIYGHKTDLMIDRKAEIRFIKLLHHHKLASNLYATFDNGLVYEYIPGVTLTADTVGLPKVYKLIAKQMAKLHKVPHPESNLPLPNLWDKMQQFYDLIPEKYEDNIKTRRYENLIPPKRKLLEEVQILRENLSNLNSPIVFSHNDLLLKNVIYDENRKKVYFIDFEYASFNYQAFDIGNHFAEFIGVNEIDFDRFPKKELQLDWLRTYLVEYYEREDVTNREILNLYIQACTQLCKHLYPL